MKARHGFVLGLAAGIAGTVVVQSRDGGRAARPPQVESERAPPEPSPAAAMAPRPVIGTSHAEPVAMTGPPTAMRFEECTAELMRDERGVFTETGRFLKPGSILRRGRIKVAVVEAYYCKPCKDVIAALAHRQLGVGVDLVVLGTGGGAPGNHLDALTALGSGAGWLYAEGFASEKLLASVFGKDHVNTPSVLIVGPENRIEAGIQSADVAHTLAWVEDELSRRGVVRGRDQPIASIDPHVDHTDECAKVRRPDTTTTTVRTGPDHRDDWRSDEGDGPGSSVGLHDGGPDNGDDHPEIRTQDGDPGEGRGDRIGNGLIDPYAGPTPTRTMAGSARSAEEPTPAPLPRSAKPATQPKATPKSRVDRAGGKKAAPAKSRSNPPRPSGRGRSRSHPPQRRR